MMVGGTASTECVSFGSPWTDVSALSHVPIDCAYLALSDRSDKGWSSSSGLAQELGKPSTPAWPLLAAAAILLAPVLGVDDGPEGPPPPAAAVLPPPVAAEDMLAIPSAARVELLGPPALPAVLAPPPPPPPLALPLLPGLFRLSSSDISLSALRPPALLRPSSPPLAALRRRCLGRLLSVPPTADEDELLPDPEPERDFFDCETAGCVDVAGVWTYRRDEDPASDDEADDEDALVDEADEEADPPEPVRRRRLRGGGGGDPAVGRGMIRELDMDVVPDLDLGRIEDAESGPETSADPLGVDAAVRDCDRGGLDLGTTWMGPSSSSRGERGDSADMTSWLIAERLQVKAGTGSNVD